MKKVLFIGNYRNSSGWGKAATDYIKALQTLPIDLSIRPIYLDGSIVQHIDLEFQLLEQKVNDSYDIVIQKVLPHLVYYDIRCGKNILLTVTETNNFEYYGWKSKFDMMDLVITPDTVGCRNIKKITKTHVVNILEPIDVQELSSNNIYKFQDINNNSFKFLFFGEHNDRKNLNFLIQAYLTEFSRFDNTYLIIKTNKVGEQPNKTIQGLVDSINNFKKQKLRKYFDVDLYPSIQIIVDHVQDIGSLYRACDCLVMPSRGESFCRPVAEAMVCGTPAIVTDNTGMADYVNTENGWLIDSTKVPCSSKQPPLIDYYTCREYWAEPNINSLMENMREAYENTELTKKKGELSKEIKNLVNYNVIGQNIWKAINV